MAIRPSTLITACAEAIHALEQVRLVALEIVPNHPWHLLAPEAQDALRDKVRRVLLGEMDRPRPDARPGEELAFETILSMARALGHDIAPFRPADPTTGKHVAAVKRAVAERLGQRVAALDSTDRSKSPALARHLAMYLCRTRLQMSTGEIGRAFGGRDHSTATNAIRRIEVDLAKRPEVREHLKAIVAVLDTPA